MYRLFLLFLYYHATLAALSSRGLGHPQTFQSNGHIIERRGTRDKGGSKKQPAKSWTETTAPSRIPRASQPMLNIPEDKLGSPPRKGSPAKDITLLEYGYGSSSGSGSDSDSPSHRMQQSQKARRPPQRFAAITQPNPPIQLPRSKSPTSLRPIKTSKPRGMIGHGRQSAMVIGHGPASLFVESKDFERDVNVSPGKTRAISIGSEHHDVAAEGRAWGRGGSVTAVANGDVSVGFFLPRGGDGYAREGLRGEMKERIKPGEVVTGPTRRDRGPPRGAASSMVDMQGEGQVGVVAHPGLKWPGT